MIEIAPTLGILRDDIEIEPAGVIDAHFAANMRRWYGPPTAIEATVVYFSGGEGVYDMPDTPATDISPFWYYGVV